MKNRKGQAAMEFLMTYGWAILVVIAAIAALAYFKVFDMTRYLPEVCTGTTDLACVGGKASTTQAGGIIILPMRNNVGGTIQLISAAAPAGVLGCGANPNIAVNGGAYVALTAAGVAVPTSQNFNIQYTGCTLTSGTTVDGDASVTYNDTRTSVPYSVAVNVRAKVK